MSGDWLRFSFLGLHPARARKLLDRYGGVTAALAAVESGVEAVGAVLLDEHQCRRRLRATGAMFDLSGASAWADSFRYIPDGPEWLYRTGTIEPTRRRVAIVGTRRCTEYGRRAAFALGEACAGAGWVVVSGMARGIDAAAARGALAGGGATIAVLGCGPDVIYPRHHRGLRDEILAGDGAVVTEYPPGAAPLGWRFPPRNRIISGLSAAVVVVESGASGGSLSTASRALAQDRLVFALPGDIDREASVGCNRLIRDGAIPVLGPDDLVEGLSLLA